jgi:hypothetical protein
MSAAKDFIEELELFGKSWNYIYNTKATLRDFARSYGVGSRGRESLTPSG